MNRDMEIGDLSAVGGVKRVNQAGGLSPIHLSVSEETKKINEWVAILKTMPEIRDLGPPSLPDPKKIAEAMLTNPYSA